MMINKNPGLQKPGFFCRSLSQRPDNQLPVFNGDRHRRTGRKPRLFKPVALKVKAGASAVAGGSAGAAALMPDTGISDLKLP